MNEPETLHHPVPEKRDDTTTVVDNGGYTHLAAAGEDTELYFDNGEDADGDPNHPANPNSRAYNKELEETDEPVIDPSGHVTPPNLEQVADLPPGSERPASERE